MSTLPPRPRRRGANYESTTPNSPLTPGRANVLSQRRKQLILDFKEVDKRAIGSMEWMCRLLKHIQKEDNAVTMEDVSRWAANHTWICDANAVVQVQRKQSMRKLGDGETNGSPSTSKAVPQRKAPRQKEVSPQRRELPQKSVSPQKNLSPQKDVSPRKSLSPQKDVLPLKSVSPKKKVPPRRSLSPKKKVPPKESASPKKKVPAPKTVSPKKSVTSKKGQSAPVDLDQTVLRVSPRKKVASSLANP